MSLRKRIILILMGVVLCYLAVSYAILKSIIYPTFGDLEERVAASNMARVEQAILTELERLSATNVDWSSWDETYQFVQDRNESYIEQNLSARSRLNVHLSAMLFFDRRNSLVWGDLLELSTGRQIPLETLEPVWKRGDEIIAHEDTESIVNGVVPTPNGPLLISSRPILHNEGEGPIGGTLVLGRYLDADMRALLRSRTEVDFTIRTPEPDSMPPGTEDLLQASAGQVFLKSRDGELQGYQIIDDVFGDPALLLEVHTRNEITGLGLSTMKIALLSHLVVGIAFVAIMWLLLKTSIVRPILALRSHILRLRETGNFTESVDVGRNDEIGTLAHEFNAMTREVVTMRRHLLEQSFRAGMAETAAGVLHNIRNVMTPLVNRVARAIRSINGIRASNIDRALGEIGGDGTPPERRQKLLDYANKALRETAELRTSALTDLDITLKQSAQVEEILAEQEHLAQSKALLEAVPLNDIVKEAISVFTRVEECDIRIDSSISKYTVRVHRLGVLQVLSSVLTNARESIERAGRQKGHISLAADHEDLQGESMIRLRVRDNGQGIATTDLIGIFRRRTRSTPRKHGALGLHWCANVLVRMGGQIKAESDGPANGAEFHLVLPAG